jgi:hypothetical protein
MNIRRTLAVAAIPVLVGTFGFISLNQASDKASFYQIAEAPQAPNQAPSGQRRPPRIDFAAAATKLGVTEQQLKDALGVPANPPSVGGASPQENRTSRPPRPDFKAAATKLGVTEQQLKDALGVPANSRRRPDFAAAATKLGVTEQQLKDALGVPANPSGDRNSRRRPDFAAAATKLGVTEQQLKDALGIPPRQEENRPK